LEEKEQYLTLKLIARCRIHSGDGAGCNMHAAVKRGRNQIDKVGKHRGRNGHQCGDSQDYQYVSDLAQDMATWQVFLFNVRM
jgi:hypothetical protein